MPLVRICAGWGGATLFPTAIATGLFAELEHATASGITFLRRLELAERTRLMR
jgi:hypothetical protein